MCARDKSPCLLQFKGRPAMFWMWWLVWCLLRSPNGRGQWLGHLSCPHHSFSHEPFPRILHIFRYDFFWQRCVGPPEEAIQAPLGLSHSISPNRSITFARIAQQAGAWAVTKKHFTKLIGQINHGSDWWSQPCRSCVNFSWPAELHFSVDVVARCVCACCARARSTHPTSSFFSFGLSGSDRLSPQSWRDPVCWTQKWLEIALPSKNSDGYRQRNVRRLAPKCPEINGWKVRHSFIIIFSVNSFGLGSTAECPECIDAKIR